MSKSSNSQSIEQIKEKLVAKLFQDQTLMFRMFKRSLKVDEEDIIKLEITYFCLSMTSWVYLMLNNHDDSFNILYDSSLTVVSKSLPHSQSPDEIKRVVNVFEERFDEYFSAFEDTFVGEKIDQYKLEALMNKLFRRVVKSPTPRALLYLNVHAPLLYTFLQDNMDFVKTEL